MYLCQKTNIVNTYSLPVAPIVYYCFNKHQQFHFLSEKSLHTKSFCMFDDDAHL